MTEVQLRELITLDKGVSYSGKYLTEDGLPMVNLKCVGRGGGFRPEGTKPYSGPHKERHRIRPGDIVIANTDLTQDGHVIGSPAIVPTSIEEGIISHHLFAVRFTSPKVDPRFLYYRLRSQDFLNHARSRASGATVLGLRPDDALDYEFDLPPISYQEKIGSILGSVDDLIENNRRRIELLEEMAQAIYREWFVHFRFPGHENATFVDSPLGPIPEGWSVEPLSDLSTLIRGRSYRKHELVEEGGLPFVNLKCAMRGGGFRLDGLKRYSGEFKPEQLVGHGDIILAVTDLTQGREILAQATLVPRLAEGKGVISLDIARIIPNSPIDRLPLYFALRCGGFADRVKEYANGATVLHLSPKHVEAGQLVWPEKALRERFNSSVEPMISSLDELRESAERLGDMRDLLLPKLVSGEIDVSDLDLDAVFEGAV